MRGPFDPDDGRTLVTIAILTMAVTTVGLLVGHVGAGAGVSFEVFQETTSFGAAAGLGYLVMNKVRLMWNRRMRG